MNSSISESHLNRRQLRDACNPKIVKGARNSSSAQQQPTELQIIHQRYLALEENFQLLLRQCQAKNEQRETQRQQLESLRAQHKKDKKEIERLTTLLKLGKESESGKKTEGLGKSHKSVPKDQAIVDEEQRTVRGVGGKHSRWQNTEKEQRSVVLKKHKFVPFLPLK